MSNRGGGSHSRGQDSRGNRRVNGASSRSSKAAEINSKDDIPFEVIEAGGEPAEPPLLTAPDAPLADFSDLFSKSPRAQLPAVVTPAVAHVHARLPGDRSRWIKEAIGGDYSRHAVVTRGTDVKQLGPLKLAQVILGRKKDVGINQHRIASEIIKTSLGSVNAGNQPQP